jgi:hypothetical protein
MRSLVLHPATGLVLDFEAEDFGGPDQEAIITDWLTRRTTGRSGRLVDPGECIADAGGLTRDLTGLTPAQQQTALELPWYRAWLLGNGDNEHRP